MQSDVGEGSKVVVGTWVVPTDMGPSFCVPFPKLERATSHSTRSQANDAKSLCADEGNRDAKYGNIVEMYEVLLPYRTRLTT